MKLLSSFLLASTILHTAATDKISELREQHVASYVEQSHPYDLHSEDALKSYLPARLQELVNQVKQNGIETTARDLANDPDLDSYLFIIDTQKPYHMLAYSRTPAFNDKTPQELQALLFPTCSAAACNVERTFTHLIATARKGTTYARYLWRAYLEPLPQYQIAYVQMVTDKDKEYVLGAAIYRQTNADHIIMPHRINIMLERIKKEGLEPILDFIIKDPDPEMYYFINSLKYPNRLLAQGANSEYLTNTTAEEEQVFYPSCTKRLCNQRILYESVFDVGRSKEGEGFQPYVLSKGDDIATTLKITYVKKFVYNKKNYIIASGHLTPISAQEIQQLEDFVHDAIKLINEIGLRNALSTLRKKKAKYSPYVVEMDPPYRYILHSDPAMDNLSAREITQRLKDKSGFSRDIEAIVKKISTFAQRGGGLHATESLINATRPQEGRTIKVTFTLPFTHNHKKYFLSASLSIDPTDEYIERLIKSSPTDKKGT